MVIEIQVSALINVVVGGLFWLVIAIVCAAIHHEMVRKGVFTSLGQKCLELGLVIMLWPLWFIAIVVGFIPSLLFKDVK